MINVTWETEITSAQELNDEQLTAVVGGAAEDYYEDEDEDEDEDEEGESEPPYFEDISAGEDEEEDEETTEWMSWAESATWDDVDE